MNKYAAAFALSLLLPTTASAVVLDSVSDSGNVVADYSEAGLISFDLDLLNTDSVLLNYRITADDLGGPLLFNAIVRNLIGTGIEELYISLGLTTFDEVGSVTRYFGGGSAVSLMNAGSVALISFDSPEYVDFAIGSPLGDASEQDWSILTDNLREGSILRMGLSVTGPVHVPEPQTVPMVLAGLGLMGLLARRRKHKLG